MKKETVFLEHILENIKKIEEFSKDASKNEIIENIQKQYALIRAVEIIGEAVRNLPDDFTKKHPDIPWKEVIGTRDKLIHHYFGVDLDILWEIIKGDIPKLKKQIKQIKEKNKEIT